MRRCRGTLWGIAALAASLATAAQAQSHGRGNDVSGHHHGPRGGVSPVTINPSNGCSPGPILAYPPLIACPPLVVWGSPGWYGYGPPQVASGVFLPYPPTPWIPFVEPVMPIFPDIPAMLAANGAVRPSARPRTRDATRAKELMELGDRLFRAGNFVRAAERYEQSIRADPDRAAPRARLAQVALVRGKYQDAANKLREAQTAEPGWLATAGDLRAIFPEPAEYARLVAKLEAHLQSQPEDRDGWLVLGALWYLSGRTQRAADVFLRLTDRREDPTLRAFLAATKAVPEE